MATSEKSTDFGYRQVNWEEKQGMVNQVFDTVARKYDMMNDAMSLGLHRLWKQIAINHSGVRPGDAVLDVASGTGDLARQFARIVGTNGQVVLTDINGNMLHEGRRALDDRGVVGNVRYAVANAEQLSFPDNTFHCITIAFGLRNVRDKEAALREFYRVLKPGGRLLVLEFSQVKNKGLRALYDAYSMHVIPRLGQLIAQDRDSYQYLVESIRKHPDQASLAAMLEAAGFSGVKYTNLTGGVVAIHQGEKS